MPLPTHLTISARAAGMLAALLAPAPLGAKPSGSDLEQLVAFDTRGAPDLAGVGRRLVMEMWTEDMVTLPGRGEVPVIRRTSRDTAEGRWVENEIALNGQWHGLNLRALGSDGIPDSGVGQYRLDFANSTAEVSRSVYALGIPLGDRVDGEGCRSGVHIREASNGAQLVVSFAC